MSKKVSYEKVSYIYIITCVIIMLMVYNLFYLSNITNLIVLIPLAVQAILLFSILLKSKYVKRIIKLWSTILVIGGGLIIVSTILYILGGEPERLNIPKLTFASIQFIAGIIFYSYCDDAIKIEESLNF